MKKYLLTIIIAILLISPVLALNLEVEKINKGSVIIAELNNPAVFDFTINNKGDGDNVEIFSLIGVSFSPRGTFELPKGKTELEIKAYPNSELRKTRGFMTFEYQIKGNGPDLFKDTIMIKIVPIDEAFQLKGNSFHPDDNEAIITIQNLQNTNLEDIKINFESEFFDTEEKISLSPYEKKNISIKTSNTTKILLAGNYPITAEIELQDATTKLESVIKYLEKESIATEKSGKGFIIRKTTIQKTNDGNVPTTTTIEIKRDILSRLFLMNSPNADSENRNGLFVTYSWEKNLNPQETLVVKNTTNYTIPFIVILLILAIAFAIRFYSRKALAVQKNVSLVRTKGGEFALKISLKVKARKSVQEIQLSDKLPSMTKLYEKFGRKPDKIDEQARKLFWNIPSLSKGETRIYSYIIYSKVKIIGRFELPSAHATFKTEEGHEEIFSNKTYFVADTIETKNL